MARIENTSMTPIERKHAGGVLKLVAASFIGVGGPAAVAVIMHSPIDALIALPFSTMAAYLLAKNGRRSLAEVMDSGDPRFQPGQRDHFV